MSDQPQQPQPNYGPPVPEQPAQAQFQGQNFQGQNAEEAYKQNPYGQPQYGQNAYGAAAPGPYGAPPFQAPTQYYGGPGYVDATSGPRGLSLASMIIGLASLVVGFGFLIIPQIVGIVLGHMGLAKESPQGKAFSITGLITNYLALVIYGGLYIVFIVIFGAAASSGWQNDYSTSAMILGA